MSESSSGSELDERELVTLFFQEGFFSVLGYGRVGEDIRLEQRTLKGRMDITLRAFAARPVAVLEFKAPGIPLAGFVDQLSSYTAEVFPEVGILTNGTDLWLFRCHNGVLLQSPIQQMNLAELSSVQARELYECLQLRHVDLHRLDAVNQCLDEMRSNPLPVSSPKEAGGLQFLTRFALTLNTPFGHLVLKLSEALPSFRQHSDFTRGAYEFWRHIYSRQLDFEETPSSWRPFVQRSGREALFQFMFSLETAYAILSRVMLSKAMQDNRFPYIDILRSFSRAIESHHERGALQSSAYVDAVASVFDEAGRQAFTPLFASDIFDWWQDDEKVSDDAELGYALAEAALAVFGFDFSPLRGDILGNLYQSYFDPETRLALGEFYTPPEVVDFILDSIEYTGSKVTVSRLLDPACGSGTFLVHALARYLDASQGQEPAAILKGLVGGLRVVGFDINPFACLMAQVNYAAQILPLFSQALQQNPQFLIPGIPVLRTDSLRQETREGESETSAGRSKQLGFRMEVIGDLAHIRTTLPVLKEGEKPKEVLITVPRFDRARELSLVSNVEEYFAALRQMFMAIKEGRSSQQDMERRLQPIPQANITALGSFLAAAAEINIKTMSSLRREYGDGRFLKTLEDTALAMILKNELSYEFVVMNPPYVRIQRLPEVFHRLWLGMYQWAQGNFDIFVPFIQRSVEGWLQAGGRLGFICSNRFMLANYATPLRRLLPEQALVKMIIDLRDTKVFQKALNYPAVCVIEKGTTQEAYNFQAGRAFAEPAGGIKVLLDEAKILLENTKAGSAYEAGGYMDAFPATSEHLKESGWVVMPAFESEVFDIIKGAGRPLEELTLTQSGGFQGYATGLDDVFVLQAERDAGKKLRLVPHGGGEPVEIEQTLLRPWLFGKDVERWYIDWAGWYVIFPYIQIEGRFQLIPSRQYGGQFTYSGKVPFIEDFDGGWKYLKSNEKELRQRENGRYLKGKREEYLWYGGARPQNLDLYQLSKILVQVSSVSSDMAVDEKGRFVFTAGGTSGVYGIIPDTKVVGPWFLLALLNSKPLDFYLKHVSTVYEGHAYSYGDQFIKQLPIKIPRTKVDKEIGERLSILARELTEVKRNLRQVEGERRSFPSPQAKSLGSKVELYPLRRIVSGEPHSQHVDPREYSVSQMLDGRWALRLGRATLSFHDETHLRLVEEWLHRQNQTKVSSDTLMQLQLPATEAGCQLVLEALNETDTEIGRLESSLKDREKEVDSLVAKLYGLYREHKKVIKEFLNRF